MVEIAFWLSAIAFVVLSLLHLVLGEIELIPQVAAEKVMRHGGNCHQLGHLVAEPDSQPRPGGEGGGEVPGRFLFALEERPQAAVRSGDRPSR